LFTALFAGNDPRSWQGGQGGGQLTTPGKTEPDIHDLMTDGSIAP
jgi:hypothetical protein